MKHSFWFAGLFLLALTSWSVPALRGQAAKPATQPTPENNSSVILLKEGHSDSVRARAAHDLGKEADPATIPALGAALMVPVKRQ